jgi:Tol biopolymer transport system component
LPGIDDRVSRTVEWAAEAVEPGDALVQVRRKKARRRLVHKVQRSALVVVVLGAFAGGLLTLIRVFGQIQPRPAALLGEGSTVFVSDRDGDAEIYLVRGEGKPTRLTDNDVDDLAPACSPDGTEVAFLRDEGKTFHAYVMKSDGTQVRRVTPERPGDVMAGEVSTGSMLFSSLSWSPDGTRIAVGGREAGLPCPSVDCPYLDRDIFSVQVKGSELVNLTDTTKTDEWDPAWSPDGSRILFVQATELTPGQPPILANIPQIYSMAANGSDIVQLTESQRGAVHPSWSPDGSRVAFESDGDIFVMNADGSGITRLAVKPPPGGNPNPHPSYGNYEPGWSPDGEQLVFVSDRDGDRDLYVMSAEGTEDQATQLIDLEGNESFPAWKQGGPQPSPVEKRAEGIQTINVGSEPNEIAIGEEGVWVTTVDAVVRLDPQTADVVARIDLAEADSAIPGGGEGIAVGFGSVWVANPEHDPRSPQGTTGGVARIDPETNRAVDSVVFTERTPTQVAVGEGAVWVTTGDAVTRLDPETLEIEATISMNRRPGDLIPVLTDIAVGEGAVWVVAAVEPPHQGNAIARIDPRTNRVVALVELVGRASEVAIGEGAVWALEEEPGVVVRIDPTTNSEVARIDLPGADGLATAEGSIWVGYIDLPGGVAMIDPGINQELRVITLESRPTDVAVAGGVVWAVAYAEGAVFRVPV